MEQTAAVNTLPANTGELQPFRGLSKDTLDTYGCYLGPRGILVMPYGGGTYKARSMDGVKVFFSSKGNKEVPLFGMDKFPKGGKTITVFEGELDAMSYYEMTGYPAVSVQSVNTSLRDCRDGYKYLMSYDNIKLNFDNDTIGKQYSSQVLALFPQYKVSEVPALDGYKDCNDFLVAGKSKEYLRLWWSAKPKRPDSVISYNEDIKKILSQEKKTPIATYPWPSLESKLSSIRSGELVVLTAETSVGKTEIVRTIEHHVLSTTDLSVGIMHLEESADRVVKGLIGNQLKKPIHLPDKCDVSTEDQMKAWYDVVGKDDKGVARDERVHIYNVYGGDDVEQVVDTIRYLVVGGGCKIIVLDHISMLVSGSADGDERRTLDALSTQLTVLTKELDFTMFLVSHVNDEGRTRGSRNIEKVADTILHVTRDLEAELETTRNVTHVMVKKNRYSGDTGPCGMLYFDKETYTLVEKTSEELGVLANKDSLAEWKGLLDDE